MAQPANVIHNWIRGHDKVPGAWAVIDGQVCTILNILYLQMLMHLNLLTHFHTDY